MSVLRLEHAQKVAIEHFRARSRENKTFLYNLRKDQLEICCLLAKTDCQVIKLSFISLNVRVYKFNLHLFLSSLSSATYEAAITSSYSFRILRQMICCKVAKR